MSSTDHPTCTVVVAGDGSKCGQPAVTSFTSLRGGRYHECIDHILVAAPIAVRRRDAFVTAESLGLKTRTTRPYVLVADGRIVGYADSRSQDVVKRAKRVGATVLPVR